MARSKTLCSHHIFCAGDKSIPYARLCAMCIEKHCPKKLRAGLRIYIHVDGLSGDVEEAATWLSEVPCTEVTVGLFGIQFGDRVSGRWHQTMVNRVAQEFAHEEVVAFVDADCFLVDGSWHKATLKHDPAKHYSLVSGFKGDPIAVSGRKTYQKMRTTLFTLQPALHNRICEQKDNKDRSAHEKLVAHFPDVHFPPIRNMDCMVTPALKAQLLGHKVESLRGSVNFSHIGGFAYMTEKRLWNLQEKAQDQWLVRLRLNLRVVEFFEELGWKARMDPTYIASLEDMVQRIHSLSLAEKLDQLPPSSEERKFRKHLEPLTSEFGQVK